MYPYACRCPTCKSVGEQRSAITFYCPVCATEPVAALPPGASFARGRMLSPRARVRAKRHPREER